MLLFDDVKCFESIVLLHGGTGDFSLRINWKENDLRK